MNNKKNWSKGVALAGAALAAGTAWVGTAQKASATPSGLTLYPSTDTYGKGVIHFDADVLSSTNGRDSTGTSEGLEYGLGSGGTGFFARTEFGADYLTSGVDTSASNRLIFNVKTQLYADDEKGIRLVAGGWDIGSSTIAPQVGYILGSKSFKFGRIHLGYAHAFGKKSLITTAGGHDDKNYIQLGYDKVFAGGKFQFTADYYSGKSNLSAIAPGLIYYMNDKSDFQLGFIHYNDSDVSTRNQIYVGFDYNFGHGAATPSPAAAPEDNTKQPAAGGAAPDRPNP